MSRISPATLACLTFVLFLTNPHPSASQSSTPPISVSTQSKVVVRQLSTPLPAAPLRVIDTAIDAAVAGQAVDPVELNNLAAHLTGEAKYEAASRLLKSAIELSPQTPAFHRNLSVVYEHMKNIEAALASARVAVSLAPRERISLVQLCGLELVAAHNSEAAACYETLTEVEPFDSRTQKFYGVALVRAGRPDKAVTVLEKAAAVIPVDSECVAALGFAYYHQKRFSDAAATLKQAVELAPNRAEYRFNLAIAQFANRNKEGAISQYRVLKVDSPRLAAELYRMLNANKVVYLNQSRR